MDLEELLSEIGRGGASWKIWLMVSDILEEAGRLEEAELLRTENRVMVEPIRQSGKNRTLKSREKRIRRLTGWEYQTGQGAGSLPR